MNAWRSVDGKKPREYVDTVLLSRAGKPNSVMAGFWTGERWASVSIAGLQDYVEPTHWMPLPEAPQ